jgi:hypothetical protein
MTDAPHDPRRDAAFAAARAPSAGAAFADALGGPLGMIESALPAAAFVAAYTVSGQDAKLSAIVAVAIAILLAVVRIARRQTLQFALSGLAGIAIAAFVVARTGRAQDFFLPGLLLSGAYAAALMLSIAVRWPIAGVALGMVAGEGMGWRAQPEKVRLYARITWIFVGVFLLRLAVQLPLYLAGWVVPLGAARVAMGLPLFAVGIWIAWLMLRRGEAAHEAAAAEPPQEREREGATLDP